MAASGDGMVTASELLVHNFVPTDGQNAESLYGYLVDVWERCGAHLGITEPIGQLGVPAAPPPRRDLDPAAGVVREPVAAASRPGDDGVFQMLLRREHDIFCLSVMLSPWGESEGSPRPGPGWRELWDRWRFTSGPDPAGLVGRAELFLGRLADPRLERVDPTPELGTACRLLLPPPAWPASTDDSGTATADGFALWEADTDGGAAADGDGGLATRRRIVVVAPHDRDAALSSWTWTRGGPGGMMLTPFTRYLLHAAKLRYSIQVWSGGTPVRALRRDTDAAATAAAALLHDSAPGSGFDVGGGSELDFGRGQASARQRRATLRQYVNQLTAAATRLTEMRRSMDVVVANMASAVESPGSASGLFTADRRLGNWFVQQLDDDYTYAVATLDRARATQEAVYAWAQERTTAARDSRAGGRYPGRDPGEAGPTRATRGALGSLSDDVGLEPDDMDLEPWERLELAAEFAQLFPTDASAEPVLALVGLPRGRRPSLDRLPPSVGWAEILTVCVNGAISPPPLRRLVAAALRHYPHNQFFCDLLHREGGPDR